MLVFCQRVLLRIKSVPDVQRWRCNDRRIGSRVQFYDRELRRQRCKNLQLHEYVLKTKTFSSKTL
jgi:hypothetical protein